jgi:hypothetical protein
MDVELTIDVPPRRARRSARPKATEAPATAPARLPRITRLMALAIKLQEMVDRGEVRDYADVARLGYVSRARMTQIMNLLNLAPDIQEYLLLLSGNARMLPERQLRPLARRARWADQRALWAQLLDQRSLRATLALG